MRCIVIHLALYDHGYHPIKQYWTILKQTVKKIMTTLSAFICAIHTALNATSNVSATNALLIILTIICQ